MPLSNLINLHPSPTQRDNVSNDNIYYDNTANISNNYFTEQSSLDDRNANLPADLDIPDITLTPYL